jgi:hypothetical protein
MRVQNRKTGAEHIISADQWNFMKSQGLHLIFKVIDKDSAGRTPLKLNIPEQINEFKIARESVDKLKIEPEVNKFIDTNEIPDTGTKPKKSIK